MKTTQLQVLSEDKDLKTLLLTNTHIKKIYKSAEGHCKVKEEQIFYNKLPMYYKKYFAKPLLNTNTFCIYDCMSYAPTKQKISQLYEYTRTYEFSRLREALTYLNFDLDRLLHPRNIHLAKEHLVIMNYDSSYQLNRRSKTSSPNVINAF